MPKLDDPSHTGYKYTVSNVGVNGCVKKFGVVNANVECGTLTRMALEMESAKLAQYRSIKRMHVIAGERVFHGRPAVEDGSNTNFSPCGEVTRCFESQHTS